ncbi:SDR family NAD(P)-dependent oxidoreductase, partial [Kitasatospora sp. NPDC006697]|uniref:SDR family NAD(P)-dependent oxidoreductase n=1 Tax=Kitasatospora sp. NPDC006697 TaxID=3364020 RepID=UPI003699D8D6
MILEQAPLEHDLTVGQSELPPPLLLSATDGPGLSRQAEALLAHLDREPQAEPVALAAALAHRARLVRGAAVLAEDTATLRTALRALAGGEVHEALLTGERTPGRTVFVFPGQGSQWPAMARELLDSSAEFRAELTACAAAVAEFAGWDLLAVLRGDPGAPSLDRVDVVQPALFAVMVGLASLWRAAGVEPDAVVGHSQGEIAAAYVAGALPLRDAVKLVTLRSRSLLGIAGGGGMVSVALGADRLEPLLAEYGGDLEIAVRNGPTATVVAGGDAALAGLLARCEERNVRARRIPVDYASHTSHVEPLREELLRIGAGLAPEPATVAYYSGVTGARLADTTGLGADYWYRNLRSTVRFEEAVHSLIDAGHRHFVEISPHPVLTFAVEEILAARGVRAFAAGTLRRDAGGPAGFRRALAAAELGGLPVAWSRTPPGALPVAGPPTYRFAADRYWLAQPAARPQGEGLGTGAERHPVLTTLLPLAGSDGALLAGRLDPRAETWLPDHRVFGTVLVPGTAFAELALRAGGLLEAAEVRELTVLAPLAPAEEHPVQFQLAVGPPAPDGLRTAELHARPTDAHPWTRHATAVLAPAVPEPDDAGIDPDDAAWPPAGAEPVAPGELYRALYARGYDYGPAFQGLTAAWRSGGRLYAEIAAAGPPEQAAGPGYLLHPAQLDAALHPVVAGLLDDGAADPERPLLPFAFEGLRVLRTGHDGGPLRVEIEPLGGARYRFALSDARGAALAEIAALAFRPIDRAQLAAGRAPVAHRIDWQPAPVAGTAPSGGATALLTGLGDPALVTGAGRVAGSLAELAADGGVPELLVVPVGATAVDEPSDPIAETHATTAAALTLLQQWLAEPTAAPGARIRFVAPAGRLATGALRGLLRAAAAEHPGRIGLTVVDGPTALDLVAGHPAERETEVRCGAVLVPRLVVADAPAGARAAGSESPGTALITGGTGALGAIIARHLAARPAPPHLLLVGRTGPAAAGAAELAAELRASGAEVTVAACDVADRTALAGLLAAIPADRPLRTVVHAAGVLADAVVTDLTADQLATALRPKVDAGWLLHELTLEHPVEEFVLFSSAVGTIGVPGQANYAAGNAFLDALATHRRAAGLPAVALAWGLWEETGAMTGHLGAADRGRLARYGIGPVPTALALDVLDTATDQEHLVVSPWDEAVLRAEAVAGRLPALFGALLRVPVAADSRTGGGAWAARLAAVPAHDRLRTLTGLLREQTAQVLGHPEPDSIAAERAFKELGFDSLTAVELRNRINALSGLTLPATVVFEHPTVASLAERLHAALDAPAVRERPVAVREAAVAEDPVVIVGMGCRFPGGVSSPEELWELVASGRDATGDFPADRDWDLAALYHPDPEHHGTSYTRRGGFLYDAGEFDAGFFGMSPREALATDPQQRLLLQVAWEALERAGIDPHSLKETDTGVFIGAMYDDYGSRLHRAPEEVEGLLLAGNESSVASGRIAYVLGLRGRALTVDTACSSSLVAL